MIPPDFDDEMSAILTWLCIVSGGVLIALLNGVHP